METVFHLSAGDPAAWERALGTVTTLLEDQQVDAEAVIVADRDAVYAMRGASPVADVVRDLLTRGIAVRVCSDSLPPREIDPENLIAGVDIVSSGVGELTRLQADGAAYVEVP